jgi:hypothetical protein
MSGRPGQNCGDKLLKTKIWEKIGEIFFDEEKISERILALFIKKTVAFWQFLAPPTKMKKDCEFAIGLLVNIFESV